MFLLVAYDIADDRLRTRVHDTLHAFGTRVQFSVFECHLTPRQVQRLYQRLDVVFTPHAASGDTIRCYPIPGRSLAAAHGLGETAALTRDPLYYLV